MEEGFNKMLFHCFRFWLQRCFLVHVPICNFGQFHLNLGVSSRCALRLAEQQRPLAMGPTSEATVRFLLA